MTEPVLVVADSVIISPDDPALRRTWPDPRAASEACWKAWHAPDTLSVVEIRQLARAAGTYEYIFSISRRVFAPSHAAIRAAMSRVVG